MEYIHLRARAKINLALDIERKREDGYHEITSIMQSLSLYDKIYIKKVYKSDYLKVITNVHWLPSDQRNLAYKAADYLRSKFDINNGIFINIEKNIPSMAGLGGGSADCAATLLGMRKLFNLPITIDELISLGSIFGADVPFCIMEGTALAKGIGEKLTPLKNIPPLHILLVKPSVLCSTKEIFSKYNDKVVTKRPNIPNMLKSIESSDLDGICTNMANVLESVTSVKHPIVCDIKRLMRAKGARAAHMTGTGPTVFGIFETYHEANLAKNEIKNKIKDISEVFITNPYFRK